MVYHTRGCMYFEGHELLRSLLIYLLIVARRLKNKWPLPHQNTVSASFCWFQMYTNFIGHQIYFNPYNVHVFVFTSCTLFLFHVFFSDYSQLKQQQTPQNHRVQCSVCGNDFANNFTLKRHMQLHTGEKPFECTVCLKRFHQKSHMKEHMIVHHKLFFKQH